MPRSLCRRTFFLEHSWDLIYYKCILKEINSWFSVLMKPGYRDGEKRNHHFANDLGLNDVDQDAKEKWQKLNKTIPQYDSALWHYYAALCRCNFRPLRGIWLHHSVDETTLCLFTRVLGGIRTFQYWNIMTEQCLHHWMHLVFWI